MADSEMDGIAAGLAAIDKTVRDSNPGGAGGPGSGLFYLLDNLAVSTLGVPRSTFPPPAAPTAAVGTNMTPPPPEADSETSGGPVPADADEPEPASNA